MSSTVDPVIPHAFPTFEEETAPLPALNGDASKLLVDLADLGTRLRQSTVHGGELDRAALRLVELVDHPEASVRRRVAVIVRYLRHESVYGLLATLSADPSPGVRAAAEASSTSRRSRALEMLWNYDGVDERARAALASRDEDVRMFAAGASLALSAVHLRIFHHELRGAMTPLLASLDVLREQLHETPLLRHVTRASERAKFILELNTGLVDATAPSETPLSDIHVRSLVAEAAEMVRDGAGELQEQLNIRVDVPVGLVLRGRWADLLVACRNVLQNGLEASHKTGPIVVEVIGRKLDDGLLSLAFIDHGVGMPAEVKRDAFTLFSTIKRGGSGIGLPFVRKVVEYEHDGVVRLDDVDGGGTRVTLILPTKHGGGAR